MDEDIRLFSELLTPDILAKAEHDFHQDMSSTNPNVRVIPPDPLSGTSKLNLDGVKDHTMFIKAITEVKPRFPPLERLPCANVEVEKNRICQHEGTMACSACKLVSYCSKACQKSHWKQHKRDCKNILRSPDWHPAWMAEGRPPSFIDSGPEAQSERWTHDNLSLGLSLWGNVPAMDVVNLPRNEKDPTKDLSLAFIASGDLRHVVRTINALPSNYSGNLKVLLNDISLHVACRNITLLTILGTIDDEAMAADIALHFWYSAFLPSEYSFQIKGKLMALLKQMGEDKSSSSPLGPHSTLTIGLSKEAIASYFSNYFSTTSVPQFQSEYDRVRQAPSRGDFRDRMYAKLKPSHRVAFQEYRRFGIILPFGAVNAHFNCPNNSLFSSKGKWLQADYADPLEGWILDEVIKAGKTHGAQAEDIYGCLYFYLSDELRSFSRRLRQLHVSFTLYSFDASTLSRIIRDDLLSEHGIPASIRFNRIEVSNILDADYVGMRGVLTNWAPLLNEGGAAAILGYFMNWTGLQQDGDATRAKNKRAIAPLLRSWLKKIESQGHKPNILKLLTTSLTDINALYENSGPFSRFLKGQGLDDILRSTKLKLRQRHTIVPHRIRAPLSGPPDALPEFPDDDSWYFNTQLVSFTWTERFVEFGRA